MRFLLIFSYLLSLLLLLSSPSFIHCSVDLSDSDLLPNEFPSFPSRITALSHFEIPLPIKLILVGFSGEFHPKFLISPSELNGFLDAAFPPSSLDPVFSLNAGNSRNSTPSALPFTYRPNFRIVHAGKGLWNKLNGVLESHIDQSTEQGHKPARIPVSAIDAIIREDFTRSSLTQVTSIYILNPKVFVKKGESASAKSSSIQYVYSASQNPAEQCPVHGWIAVGSREQPDSPEAPDSKPRSKSSGRDRQRYLWFDLNAGPLSFGPALYGDGIVTEASLPHPSKYISTLNSTTTPGQIRHITKDFLASLSGTIRNSIQLLLAPTFYQFPLKSRDLLRINFVFIHERHDTHTVASESTDQEAERRKNMKKSGSSVSSLEKEKWEWNQYEDSIVSEEGKATFSDLAPPLHLWQEWNYVEQALESLSIVSNGNTPSAAMSIEFNRVHLKFEECELCVAAYTHSLKAHTNAVELKKQKKKKKKAKDQEEDEEEEEDEYEDGELQGSMELYLDSSILRDWLEHFDRSFWGMKEDSEKDSNDRSIRALNVFIYDLNAPTMFLDRIHQAVAFNDLVIAVQSKNSKHYTEYQCSPHLQPSSVSSLDSKSNKNLIAIDPRDASRPTLAAILSAAFGVSPSFASFQPAVNEEREDFLFSYGHTPFAPFSQSKKLHFALQDAANRGEILSRIYTIRQEMKHQLNHLYSHSQHSKDVDSDSSSSSSSSSVSSLRNTLGPMKLSHLLSTDALSTLLEQWKYIQIQLKSSLLAVSIHEYGEAYRLLSDSQLNQARQTIRQLIRQALKALQVELRCSDAPVDVLASSSSSTAGSSLISSVSWFVLVNFRKSVELIILIGVVGLTGWATSASGMESLSLYAYRHSNTISGKLVKFCITGGGLWRSKHQYQRF